MVPSRAIWILADQIGVFFVLKERGHKMTETLNYEDKAVTRVELPPIENIDIDYIEAAEEVPVRKGDILWMGRAALNLLNGGKEITEEERANLVKEITEELKISREGYDE